ncbi:LacI family DNA-binding transcriptional regulator [Demequina muriae]|uniref:LacI family DNA-binding transcriptional regulator n=1 Tax=Demequina muriae TaxID=3051664 RepID=A0ABT8GE90_9MICO|nr:LacI family DNA-binding transcriptional regulator [Demequina sp. EGI L300058]MDN4479742.1 LacI family DNA-binding transcriptional regulator [Demequina sp. EGI L300058]
MATIYEVAAHAEVSPATVSRVMNGTAVRPELETRVREAIAHLEYRPSRRARSLRTNQSEMVALVIPDIENPFFTALARGAEGVMRQAGYSLVLCNTDDNPDYEASYVQVIQDEGMPGAIVAPSSTGTAFVPLLDEGRPVVAVDRHIEDPRADAVMADNFAGAAEATEWQFAQGSSRVACITGPPHAETARARAEAWREVCERNGGALDEYLVWTDFQPEGGADALDYLLDLPIPPNGIVAANNLTAVGMLAAMVRRGINPGEITVSACEMLPRFSLPLSSLLTVPLPAREIGAHAARLLLARIDGDTSPAKNVVLDSDGNVVSAPPHPATPPAS